MASGSRVSPNKRPLNLKRPSQPNNNEEQIENKPSTSSQNTSHDNNYNFMKACKKVSYDAYQDYKKRFQLIYVPDCINNMCNHGDKNAKIRQISKAAEQTFLLEYNKSAWHEALEICLVCTTPSYYLSANVLRKIVEIIMNAREVFDSGYPIEYLLRKCQSTLMMHFLTHPPCFENDIRGCYKDFLISPMDSKELSHRTVYSSGEGIISHCFSRLVYEISMESKDGTMIEENEIANIDEGVKHLHWKNENLQLLELLGRNERIERCMLVLETIIYLIQTDMALWDARCSSPKSPSRAQKPFLAYVLWQNTAPSGAITPLCHTIMQLFAYYIHLEYPERCIKIMGLWMNAVIQLYYMNGAHAGFDYPYRSKFIAVIARDFYKIIQPLPNESISRILERIQPTFMQHLVGKLYVQHLLHTNEEDILNIIIWSLKSMSWDGLDAMDCDGDEQLTSLKKTRKKLKPGKLLDHLSKKCKIFLNADQIIEKRDKYPKFKLTQNTTSISKNHIINTMYTTFVAYLEAYSIMEFNQTLAFYEENKDDNDPTNSKTVSNHFVKQYRSMVKSLQELLLIVNNKQLTGPARELTDLINDYFPE